MEERTCFSRWRILAIFVTSAMIFTSILVPGSTMAGDQAHSMTDFFSNPQWVSFHSVVWNEKTYQYAIGLGHDSNYDADCVYVYTPDEGWRTSAVFLASTSDKYYDIIFDPSSNGTFYISGSRNSNPLVRVISFNWNASAAVSSDMVLSIDGEIDGISIDAYSQHDKYLVCVGKGNDSSGNSEGMIMVHNLSQSGSDWQYYYTGKGQILNDVTFNGGGNSPLFIMVGANGTSGKGIAYAFDYSGFWPIDVPDDCSYLSAVSWYTADPDGYAIAVGENSTGNGAAYRIDVNFPGPRVAYTRTKSPYSLRFLYGSNEGHFFTPVFLAHANFTSLALSPSGAPMIAYYNNQTHHLMYASFRNGRWNNVAVDTDGDVGMYCSIVSDYIGRPYIAYYDRTNGYLKMAWYDNGWHRGVIDSSGTAGKYTDMLMDDQGHIHISYLDTAAGVKYAYFDGSAWSVQVVDSSGTGATAIAVDSSYHPHIAYEKGNAPSYSLDYRYYNGNSWANDGFSPVSFNNPVRPHMAINSTGAPHIVSFDDTQGFSHIYKEGNNWKSETVQVGGSPEHYAHDGAMAIEPDDSIDVFFSYVNSSVSKLSYSLNYSILHANSGTWESAWGIDSPYTGGAPSAAFLPDFRIFMKPLPSSDPQLPLRPLFGVAWSPDGSQATLVGESGEIYLYYDGKSSISLWNENGPGDFYDVAVKPPGSPSYSLAVGPSNSAIISTQVADTSTSISAKNILPHINEMDFRDRGGISRLNQQVDVGSTYVFWANTSYQEGWGKIGLNITAWYDGYDGTSEQDYNSTPGKNLNFKIHFQPDPVDPYNRSGNCTLLWPNTEEVKLERWDVNVIDNPSAGSQGINDGHDYYIIEIFVYFGPQMAYAPGDGEWDNASDQSNPSIAFNDPYSWDFNMTIYDRSTPTARESRYDEFGIYAYTEISAEGNPSGSGVPSSLVSLSPSSRIYIRTNVEYNVTVNITNLQNATGARYIDRTNVQVINQDPNGANTTSNTQISQWTSFSGDSPLFVWGTSGPSGAHMPPLLNGVYTAGYTPGYSSSPSYTVVSWRIYIPAGTQEDSYKSMVTYTIDYVD